MVLVAVALAVGAVTVVVLVTDNSGIHEGAGTATFTWVPVHQEDSVSSTTPAPQPFTGDIEGHAVTGTSTLVIPSSPVSSTGQLPTGPTPVFRYEGTFAGSPFDLTVDYTYPTSTGSGTAAAAAALAAPRFTVTGTYGHSAVRATVSLSAAVPTADRPARFAGTIGQRKVTGTISSTTGTSAHRSVTAHFVVSG